MIKKFKIFEQNSLSDFNEHFNKWLTSLGLDLHSISLNGFSVKPKRLENILIKSNKLGESQLVLDIEHKLSTEEQLNDIISFSKNYNAEFEIKSGVWGSTLGTHLNISFHFKDLSLLHKFIEQNPDLYPTIPKNLKVKEIVAAWGHIDGGYEFFDSENKELR